MKILISLIFMGIVVYAQGNGPATNNLPPPPLASLQPAQTISIPISSELATALENIRLNIRDQKPGAVAGSIIVGPRYNTISELIIGALTAKGGGLFTTALTRFPPDSIKVSQAAAKKAKDDADAIADKVLSGKP